MKGPEEAGDVEALLREETCGEYVIERELGRGWGGVLYLATEISIPRPVAIKVFSPTQTLGKGAARRFLHGAQLAAALDHPNILPIYRLSASGRLLWYAMQYVGGETLADVLRHRGRLSLEDTIRILRPLADALDYVHGHHVIHRDVKPFNVMIAADGRVMLTDFELAKQYQPASLTASGSIVGTPYYMSGQARGKLLTQAADQYSVGVMAYSMLAGQVLFEAESVVDILRKHCSEQPVPLEILRPGLPPGVYAAVDRALAKEPLDRFSSVGAFVEALASVVAW
ncbi:MAG: serine/threonine-protein kinase [Gemmatimonadales bacterium]